jgi:hypothetical protein
MFPSRLSEVAAEEVQAIIDNEVAETTDFELKRDLPSKKGADPWMTNGKLGDDAKDELAAEIIAFANTAGGTLVVGIDEDTTTKRAKPPIFPIPQCKDAAARLHQAITDRIEPKLPVFECEGVVTESDGTSGVIVMRTLESYLAPHRHAQNKHCYVRRHDRAEPMSMLEIQDLTRRVSTRLEEVDRAFRRSETDFYAWIPEIWHRSHPSKGVQGHHDEHGTTKVWNGLLAIRVTARPLAPLVFRNLPQQRFLQHLKHEPFTLDGRSGQLTCPDVDTWDVWRPRLRAVEKAFRGDVVVGLDRVSHEGQIERFFRLEYRRQLPRTDRYQIAAGEIMWNPASVIRMADIIRREASRPSQAFAIEMELMSADPAMLFGYPGPSQPCGRNIPAERVVFPRYEMGSPETLNDLLAAIDTDLWHLAGLHPEYQLAVKWPPMR